MSSHTVGVFPAPGGIGGSTVKHLLPRLPPQNLVFIARNPAKLADASAAGATVRKADYDDEASLEHAFDGINILFLISYASVENEYRVERHHKAINLALRSGVTHIFYGSLGFAGPETSTSSVAHVMKPHLTTEQYLAECIKTNPRLSYTVIREGLYSESFLLYTAFFDPLHPVSEINIPHDGAGPGIAWVKREELGEGTAELLKRFVGDPTGFKFLNRMVLLSGSRILSLRETMEILGRVAGGLRLRLGG
ncbi:NAD(P)-binding protein [Aspergillus ellipticus CBS 707.79]|uniref:NAD(P)-binding protein n=1 Tax=Aspergillus ellipticus CBS 707.79 TaxID=1448320 RepID=A0A319DS56_9EURO|nr:NAD(P)-binding protein [Aspergillus ellipticus CBS 707.79]